MRPRAGPTASSAPHVAASRVAVKYTYRITRPASKFDSRPGTSRSPTARSAFVPCRYTPGSKTSNGTGSPVADIPQTLLTRRHQGRARRAWPGADEVLRGDRHPVPPRGQPQDQVVLGSLDEDGVHPADAAA